MKFLGSYPGRRADGGRARARAPRPTRRGATPRTWVDELRGADPRRRPRDRPQAAARRARSTARGIERKRVARRTDRRRARGRRRTRRVCCTEVEELRAAQNAASKEIGKAAPDERAAKIAAAAALKEELAAQGAERSPKPTRALRELALQVPNPADASVPDGGEDDGEVLRDRRRRTGAAPPLDHAAFARGDGLRRHRAGGARRAARASRTSCARRCCSSSRSCSWVDARRSSPRASRRSCRPCSCASTRWRRPGFFPTDRSQVYDVDDGELFLVGTSEVPLSALHRGEIVRRRRAPAALRRASRRASGARPARTARTPAASSACTSSTRSRCSRFAHPDESWDEHERILAIEESIIGGLGLPYRVVNIAAGDLGPAAAKKYDIEVWLPSEGRYRELTSCSNYLDYSARRLGTRVPGRRRHRARAHAQRHRVRDRPHARVPVRALPGSRRRRSPSPTCCVPFIGFDHVEPRRS